MAHRLLTETAISISEHNKNPMVTVAAGEGMAVAVLNRNEPAFNCVPARKPPWRRCCATTVCSRSCACSAARFATPPSGPPGLPSDRPIQELMRRLAEDPHRTNRIVAEALACWAEGPKLLLLSERTDHITAIATARAPERAPAQRHPGRAGSVAS